MSSILRARQIEDIPAPHVGQEAIIRLGRAIQSDISGANDVFRTHNALVADKTLITGMPGHDDTKVFAVEAEGRPALACRLTAPPRGARFTQGAGPGPPTSCR